MIRKDDKKMTTKDYSLKDNDLSRITKIVYCLALRLMKKIYYNIITYSLQGFSMSVNCKHNVFVRHVIRIINHAFFCIIIFIR